ncbi:NAD(P)-binding protein [Conidiobolus coronatus NRRL 28638]|uniref:NAD(P)-binding protein n=1 Tax=Conidiobolus coronatus (strain ATCC 28846 / CBS 209.66 / NRRL 28638) TaxID=796925 RepID=A0A137NQZ0_CONC2|nr:NAD(P)-binding protein [Conidiobolus coronatus NRRL 28638]|eukprot:KXN65183.1 NAD(P)-binding protein [Conidiobolus coronatus NRRL 28638]
MNYFKAITFDKNGDVGVLHYSELPKLSPGPGQVLVKNKSIGVNYIDLYHRDGSFPAPVQGILGVEAAGIIEEIGPEVSDVLIEDRVAYLGFGTYGEYTVVDRNSIVKVPDSISLDSAAAVFADGMKSLILVKEIYQVKKGDIVLVQAADSSTGLHIIALSRYLGATVIGVVSKEEKLDIALKAGAHHVITYNTEDIAKRVLAITHGRGADVIYDNLGQITFDSNLESIKKFGTFISFGKISGEIEPFDVNKLATKNIMFSRITAYHYLQTKEDVEYWAGEMFKLFQQRVMGDNISRSYLLKDAKLAQIDLENDSVSGKLVLKV